MKCRRTPAHGGPGGGPFADNLTQAASMVGFVLEHGSWVFGIGGIYKDAKGKLLKMQWHGGHEGTREIVIFDTDEYITRVQGQTAKFDHGICVSQLKITTNKQAYGPYGAVGGEKWEIIPSKPEKPEKASPSKLVGFFGRSGTLIDQIGLFELVDDTVWLPTETYGGEGPNHFSTDLTEVNRLIGVTVRHGDVIDAIQATFRKTDGTEYSTPVYGGPGGARDEFRLDDDEYLAWVKVHAGNYYGWNCVTQLLFKTVKTVKFGGGVGTEFKPVGDFDAKTQIGGFFGQYGHSQYLDQIGFFVLATQVVTGRPITREEVLAMMPKAKEATPALAGANK